MNPCPCGYYNHPEKECTCPPGTVEKYLNRISGPLLDRIDLHVEVTPVSFDEIASRRKMRHPQRFENGLFEQEIFRQSVSKIIRRFIPMH
jgi:predicted ATPase with chaperone activity